MKWFEDFRYFLRRLKYPASLPEDIAEALGVECVEGLSFRELLDVVTDGKFRPGTLHKFMSRSESEAFFRSAMRTEFFRNNSLFSYYINRGWMGFELEFDSESRLRRLYFKHRCVEYDRGIEIMLREEEVPERREVS